MDAMQPVGTVCVCQSPANELWPNRTLTEMVFNKLLILKSMLGTDSYDGLVGTESAIGRPAG